MKLILASDLSFLLKYGYDLTGIPKDQIKIGRIITASKGEDEKTRVFIAKVKDIIIENGYSIKDIDIENKTKEELENFFKDKNIIHIEGGNTFYLLKAMKVSGFDKMLMELIKDGKVYIGTSAGAAVMGISIKSSSGIPENTPEDVTNGLGIVPFVIKAHYTEEKNDMYKEKTKDLKYPVKFLRDGQGFLVEDDKYTFIGDGKEVVLQ
jgi:dipeptidase E